MDPIIFDTPDGLRLDVRIGAGIVEVHTSETSQTRIEITGARADDMRVDVRAVPGGGHRVVVEQRTRKVLDWGSGRDVAVVASVPEGTRLDVTTGSADLRCTGKIAELAYRTGSGSLRFGEVEGTLDVRTASGDVRGERVGADLSVASASGDADVRRVDGAVRARTVSGSLSFGAVEDDAQITGVSGDIWLASAGGDVTARSVSGDVTVGVVPGRRVWLDLGSASGETVSELGPADDARPEGPQVEIRVTTVSGDVRVRRADDESRLSA
jgi:Toastrack DUF4097